MSDQQSHPTPFEPKPAVESHVAPQHMSMTSGSPEASKEAPKAASAQEPNRLLAACSYLGVLFLIPLLVEKDDAFVKFHLRQGIALFVIGVIASFGFHYRRGGSMLMFAVVVVSLVAAIRAFNNEKWSLPVIGKYAAKIEL